MIGAIVLAAGESKRMGRPKMTLQWNSRTVIGQVVHVLLDGGVDDVIVVTGGAHSEVENAIAGMGVRSVHNPDFANGEMIQTLQIGLKNLKKDVLASLVVLGDQPQIEVDVVRTVISAFEQKNHSLVVPSYGRKRGHPWLIARTLWDRIFELRKSATMRQFLNRFASEIHYVNVDTNSIFQDLDTPEDYRRFQSEKHGK